MLIQEPMHSHVFGQHIFNVVDSSFIDIVGQIDLVALLQEKETIQVLPTLLLLVQLATETLKVVALLDPCAG